ncbi:MAG: hypothetical protein JWQ74_1546 [Marmoricola sp.]|nr:hypothetical protein [Marmoricola sp.]
MKSPFKRRTAFATLLLAPVLAACGFSAQTDQVYQAAVGVNDRSSDVYVLNSVIISGTDGTGTYAGTFVNTTTTPHALKSVSGDGVQAVPGKGVVLAVASLGSLNLGAANDTGVVPITITGAAVKPGGYVKLTFTFDNDLTVTQSVPVFGPTEDYKSVPLAPAPTASDAPATPDATPAAE